MDGRFGKNKNIDTMQAMDGWEGGRIYFCFCLHPLRFFTFLATPLYYSILDVGFNCHFEHVVAVPCRLLLTRNKNTMVIFLGDVSCD
jgi:hypothetical protein